MERVFEYEIPLLHPLAVHFPIALLTVAAVLVLIWAVRDRESWLRSSAILAAAGAIGAIVANRTGEAMEEEAEGSPVVEALVDLHDAAADWTVLASVILGVVLWVLVLFSDRLWPGLSGTPWSARLVVALLALVAAGMVAWTGHIGGIMVWGVAH